MTSRTQSLREELRVAFADTLDKKFSRFLIMVSYRENGQLINEIGVPYSLHEKVIRVGPYIKDSTTTQPSDLHDREKLILISNITGYRRIELSDII